MRLANLLKLHRVAKGIDQRTLAAEIGINAPALSRLETGKTIHVAETMKVLVWLCGESS